MKASKLLIAALSLLLFPYAIRAGEEVDRLLAEYARIETVTCQIRRTKDGPSGKIRFLNRVYYTNKNQLHAEGIAPVKRRTIADGQRLWQYAQGDPKGFSRPISELSEQMAISLKMVPGTAMDHLLMLKGLEESPLPPSQDAVRQIGIQADSKYVVLQFDDAKRLVGIRFFKTPEMKQRIAQFDYRDFIEAVPGVWIPLTHEIKTQSGDLDYAETVRIDRFVANKPIAESLFMASSFFDNNVDFVDDFTKIFPQ